ncbi:ORF V: Enzymatic polyprotein [Labeo rohita]|uniref:ORF V: Enzymatic polyprotein n=1 Tax=Labeo rohita TaxID=84645 RepID=A0ABQ8L540_LABRO|nr:ORF V: Enzymatic polyprotein [Labeo rohita]
MPTCLGHVEETLVLVSGPGAGSSLSPRMLGTDASLTGWGVVMSGHPARGLWSGHHPVWHFSCLEMLAAFQVLKSRETEQSYRIQFGAPPPPFNGVSTVVSPEQGLVMEQEVETLLRKEAIEVVPPHDRESGFYSRYFVVPKKDGGLRPLFRSETTMRLKFNQVVSQIRSEDWFVTVDLKGAYFHVSILPQHRKFLRAGVETERQEECAVSITENHLSRRGVGFDHDAGTFVTCSDRVDPHCSHERVKEGRSLTVKQFQRLLGLMAAASNVIPFGLLYMRPLQWWLRTKGFSPEGKPVLHDQGTRQCLRALDMWKKPWFLSQGPVLGAPCRRITIATDASLTGWGAVMSGHPARGLWSSRHLTWHINCLEMLAVFRALKHFLPDLIGHHVLVCTDNTAVDKLLSLRAVHVPGHLNMGADILLRQGLRPGEWMLHPRW